MRRLIPFVIVGVILTGAVPAAYLAFSRSTATHDRQSPVAVTSAVPTDPVEGCVVAVMSLLGQTIQAVQQGYQGLNLDEVAAHYGTESAVFQTFSATQAVLIGRVISKGADGQLTAIESEVRQRCAELS